MMTPVESFIHRENIKNFERRLADRRTDEEQRKMLARLLAEENRKLKARTAKAPQKQKRRPTATCGWTLERITLHCRKEKTGANNPHLRLGRGAPPMNTMWAAIIDRITLLVPVP